MINNRVPTFMGEGPLTPDSNPGVPTRITTSVHGRGTAGWTWIPPPPSHKVMTVAFGRATYKHRNSGERCINRLTRGTATRYEKPATVYLIGLRVAAILIWSAQWSERSRSVVESWQLISKLWGV
ncbi:hypothetical protein [Streptomyces sp. NPDC006415]|uniref:hypothetical protein n=1 Tax=Streptomyces sp. NPDC006415 TaxID=3155351 RepID=UPI00339DF568